MESEVVSETEETRSVVTTVKCEPVKEEPEWGECGVSDTFAAEDLDAGHDDKHEIVVKPKPGQQDDAISTQTELNRTEEGPFQLNPSTECTQTHSGEGPHRDISHKQQYSSDDVEFVNTKKTSNSHDDSETQLRNQADSNTHSSEKPDSCSVCNKQFKTQSALKRHMKTHTAEKTFTCDVCAKKFVRKYNLMAHRINHTRNKLFSCYTCDIQFTKRKLLVKHRRRKHPREKTLSSSFSSKQSTNEKKIEGHLHKDTNDTLYNCDICEKKYSVLGIDF